MATKGSLIFTAATKKENPFSLPGEGQDEGIKFMQYFDVDLLTTTLCREGKSVSATVVTAPVII